MSLKRLRSASSRTVAVSTFIPPAMRERASNLHRSVQRRLADFSAAKSGAAAIEFAIIVPVLAGALLLMIDFALAVQMKFDVARKQRMAIEGVLRYGDDKDAVMNFANVDGRAAFNMEAKVANASTPTLAIKRFFTCRSIVGVVNYDSSPLCLKPEVWFELKTSATYTGSLGKKIDLSSKTSIMVKS